MANSTNPENWAAQERLRFIERSLWWRGEVKRKDLRELFGISLAQASSDLQRYLETNPTAARYDLKGKTYRGEPFMVCVYHEPRLEEALSLFLGESGGGGYAMAVSGRAMLEPRATDRVTRVLLPLREGSATVARAVFQAVCAGLRLTMEYGSMTGRRGSGEAKQRSVVPHAFAHDGYRWHVRAWCEENADYRDFVLSRIRTAEWPTEAAGNDLPSDEDWETFEELVLVPNPKLEQERQDSIAGDFGMSGGRLCLRVRRAMRRYTLLHLRLAPEGESEVERWVVEE
jgi:hypothetical protein